MNVNIEELKRKAEVATEGPWHRFYGGTAREYRVEVEGCILAEYIDDVDSAYIAAANPAAVLELIAEIERVTKQRDELLGALRDVVGWVPGRDKWHTDEPINAVERAHAAIAKVEG